MSEDPQPQPAERRGAIPWRVVGSGLVVSLALALAFGAYVYFVMLRFERVAAYHLPAEAVAVARVDVEQAVLYDPVRRHVLPVVDEALRTPRGSAGPDGSGEPDGLERLEAATRINLGRDLREVVVAAGPGDASWLVVLGGMFPRSGVVAGLVGLLNAEGERWVLGAEGSAVGPAGVAVGQAGDGAVLIASSPAWLAAALPRGTAHATLGIAPAGPGALSVDLERWGRRVPFAQGVRGALEFGEPLRMSVTLRHLPAQAPGAAADGLFEWLATASAGPQLRLQRGAAAPSAPEPDHVRVVFSVERSDLDRLAAFTAERLRSAWSGAGREGGGR